MIRCDTSALILAGGQGSRMGGIDKGLVRLVGKPLIEWVIEALRQQVGDVLISANRSVDQYATLGYPVLQDAMPGFPGPLAGVMAGLGGMTTDELLVVPCDVPLLPRDLVFRMRPLLTPQTDLVVAADPERIHPAIFLCRAQVKAALAAYLAQGGRSVRGWQATLNTVTCPFEDASAFSNLNNMADLERTEQQLRTR
ncbi:molybdopterin-guanine dinucleotide biosynthesis protein A [Chitinivorax tropicus]|uniref:Molybdenum cofactor guanylyltransferase n=1 Tax=Chitinivorax tropicus TaxID=714531 RepID=A0A840MQK7_9PROT|nr:molybdenum cofactor guanylyltransferase MobA [Chitinivorax tropicus]MBB5017531.1 molybdopterin-guanine dinucleotide biosynthesis protein A [Chitinivorax tropicus]